MHIYHLDGNDYPSVTTIIHSLGSDDLMKWSNIMGFKHKKYEDLMEQSSSWGTLVHSHLQNIVDPENAKPIPPNDGIQEFRLLKLKSKFSRFMVKYPYQTIYTEKTLISAELGYGGTLDWYTIINGLKMLMDFKTSKRVQINMLLQLGGYYNLMNACLNEDPDGAAIIIINDNTCSLNPIDREELREFGQIFNHLAKFYIANQNSKVRPNESLRERLTTG